MPLHARKRLGQHFLHDPAVIERLGVTEGLFVKVESQLVAAVALGLDGG